MTLSARARRATAGLGSLAVLSAAWVPVWIEVASRHRSHWSAEDAAAAFWREVVVPGAGRGWAVAVGLALFGWSATAALDWPTPAGRAARAASAATLGWGVVLVASLPGWVWLYRLGAAPGREVAAVAGIAALPLALGALLAAGVGERAGPVAVLLVAGSGAAGLWTLLRGGML